MPWPAFDAGLGGMVHGSESPVLALVVDDEFLIAIELEAVLTEAGYQVMSAVNVAEARALVEKHPIDVAILDFRMGEGAVALAHDLMAKGVPLVFCTGSLADEVHALFPGVPVVAKPFAGETLLSGVAIVLPR